MVISSTCLLSLLKIMSTFVLAPYHLHVFVSLVRTVCVDPKLNIAKRSRLGHWLTTRRGTQSFKNNLELSTYLISFGCQISLDHICSTFSRLKIRSLDGIGTIEIEIT